MSNILKKIEANISNYGSSQKHLALFILSNYETIPNMTITALAKSAYCSPSSVSRFVNKLGFESYYDFCHNLKLGVNNNSEYTNIVNTLCTIDTELKDENLTFSAYKNMYIECNEEIKYLVFDAVENQEVKDPNFVFFTLDNAHNKKIQALSNASDLIVYINCNASKNTLDITTLQDANIVIYDLYGTLITPEMDNIKHRKILNTNQFDSNLNRLLISHLLSKLFNF